MRKFSYRKHWKLGEVDTGAGATMLENFGMYHWEGIIIWTGFLSKLGTWKECQSELWTMLL